MDLLFPISKGKMESDGAWDADSPSHNISRTSTPDKPPFKMMYGSTYLLQCSSERGLGRSTPGSVTRKLIHFKHKLG